MQLTRLLEALFFPSSPFFSDSLQSLLCTVFFFLPAAEFYWITHQLSLSAMECKWQKSQLSDSSAIFRRSPFLCVTWLPSLLYGNNHTCFVLALIGGSLWCQTEWGSGDSDHVVERMTRDGDLSRHSVCAPGKSIRCCQAAPAEAGFSPKSWSYAVPCSYSMGLSRILKYASIPCLLYPKDF